MPRGRVDHAVDHAQEGRLARAGRADEHGDLARRDDQREVVDREVPSGKRFVTERNSIIARAPSLASRVDGSAVTPAHYSGPPSSDGCCRRPCRRRLSATASDVSAPERRSIPRASRRQPWRASARKRVVAARVAGEGARRARASAISIADLEVKPGLVAAAGRSARRASAAARSASARRPAIPRRGRRSSTSPKRIERKPGSVRNSSTNTSTRASTCARRQLRVVRASRCSTIRGRGSARRCGRRGSAAPRCGRGSSGRRCRSRRRRARRPSRS